MTQIVILSTADYGAEVWTNKQHLAVGLAEVFDVTYIESMGLRTPKLSASDLRRVLRRLKPSSNAAVRPRPERLSVVGPHVLPWHASSLAAGINRRLVRRQFRRSSPERRVLWTFSPLTYGLEGECDAMIYHSVDLLHAIPGVPADTILDAERRALASADVVIASSHGVREHLQALGRKDVLLWENVADVELYARHESPKEPRAVFAGNLTPTKIDLSLLSDVALAGIPISIAGPRDIDGTVYPEIDQLLEYPNVTYEGNLSPVELAGLLNRCTVGLIPYQCNSYTEGVFPMKVYEYLASGCSVVSVPLRSLRELRVPGLFLEADSAEFVSAVVANLSPGPEAVDAYRLASAPHSWTARVSAARNLIDGIADE